MRPNRRKTCLACVLLPVLHVACAPFVAPMAPSADDALAKKFEVPKDKALVFVKRIRVRNDLSYTQPVTLSLGDRKLGAVGEDQFVYMSVDPGKHTVAGTLPSVEHGQPPAQTEFETKAGDIAVAFVGSDTQFPSGMTFSIQKNQSAALDRVRTASLVVMENPPPPPAGDPNAKPAESPSAEKPAAPKPEDPRVEKLVPDDDLLSYRMRKVAVPRFKGTGVEASDTDILTQQGFDRASSVRGLIVTRPDYYDLVVSGKTAIDTVLAGMVTKIGSTYNVSLTLIDHENARQLVRVSARVNSQGDVLGVVDKLVDHILIDVFVPAPQKKG